MFVDPIASISIDISASLASALSDITAGVAAVVLVVSLASIVSFVLSMVVPPSFMSTVNKVPPVAAVVNEALTASTVYAYGILKTTFSPVVKSLVSSEHAITKLVVRLYGDSPPPAVLEKAPIKLQLLNSV